MDIGETIREFDAEPERPEREYTETVPAEPELEPEREEVGVESVASHPQRWLDTPVCYFF